MPHYEIILYWSNEDQAFIAETPELLGCMAGSWQFTGRSAGQY